MLNEYPQEHLNQDELHQAMVAPSDLGAPRRSHLEQCAACQNALDRLEQRFERLGQMARRLAPAPSGPFRLPQKAVAPAGRRFKPVWATGLLAAVILIFAVWWTRPFTPSTPIPNMAQQAAAADGALLDQVDALVDDALPPVLQQLAAASDLDDTDNSVIDWVVPPVDDMQDEDSLT
jgi:hypothetical protein